MTGYVLGFDAEFDLAEIWEYIAADSVDAADKWIEKLFDIRSFRANADDGVKA